MRLTLTISFFLFLNLSTTFHKILLDIFICLQNEHHAAWTINCEVVNKTDWMTQYECSEVDVKWNYE